MTLTENWAGQKRQEGVRALTSASSAWKYARCDSINWTVKNNKTQKHSHKNAERIQIDVNNTWAISRSPQFYGIGRNTLHRAVSLWQRGFLVTSATTCSQHFSMRRVYKHYYRRPIQWRIVLERHRTRRNYVPCCKRAQCSSGITVALQ